MAIMMSPGLRIHEKMSDTERKRHDEMLGEHHAEMFRRGVGPVKTDVHSRTSVGSQTPSMGRLWSTDNGREVHHQWYTDEGDPVHSPLFRPKGVDPKTVGTISKHGT